MRRSYSRDGVVVLDRAVAGAEGETDAARTPAKCLIRVALQHGSFEGQEKIEGDYGLKLTLEEA